MQIKQTIQMNLSECLISQIDLDTIDVSNLNRQFLFRKEHVGKSKAQVTINLSLRLVGNIRRT